MYLYLVVGSTGQGKSTIVKQIVKGTNIYVFDVQNEYPNLPGDTILLNRSFRNETLNHKKYIENCRNIKGFNCIIEEATGFFRGNMNTKVIQTFLSKRHNKNNYFLCFHSICSIPKQIFQFSNYLILFKTNEERQDIESRYPSLLSDFDKVKATPFIKPVSGKPTVQNHIIKKLIQQ